MTTAEQIRKSAERQIRERARLSNAYDRAADVLESDGVRIGAPNAHRVAVELLRDEARRWRP